MQSRPCGSAKYVYALDLGRTPSQESRPPCRALFRLLTIHTGRALRTITYKPSMGSASVEPPIDIKDPSGSTLATPPSAESQPPSLSLLLPGRQSSLDEASKAARGLQGEARSEDISYACSPDHNECPLDSSSV